MQRMQVPSLVAELRSGMPQGDWAGSLGLKGLCTAAKEPTRSSDDR